MLGQENGKTQVCRGAKNFVVRRSGGIIKKPLIFCLAIQDRFGSCKEAAKRSTGEKGGAQCIKKWASVIRGKGIPRGHTNRGKKRSLRLEEGRRV